MNFNKNSLCYLTWLILNFCKERISILQTRQLYNCLKLIDFYWYWHLHELLRLLLQTWMIPVQILPNRSWKVWPLWHRQINQRLYAFVWYKLGKRHVIGNFLYLRLLGVGSDFHCHIPKAYRVEIDIWIIRALYVINFLKNHVFTCIVCRFLPKLSDF